MTDYVDPLIVTIEIDLLKLIDSALKILSEDLSVYLNAEYPEETRKKYPTYERRYQNGMKAVVDAMYCMDRIDDLLVLKKEV